MFFLGLFQVPIDGHELTKPVYDVELSMLFGIQKVKREILRRTI